MLKSFLLFSAVILFEISAISAPTLAAGGTPQEAAPAPSTNPVKPTPASQARAKNIYAVDCALCHGDNGNGKTDLAKDMQLTLLDWTDPKALGNLTDQQLFHIIRSGKDKMPSEDANRAKDDEVWNLVIYIRGMSKGQPAEAPPADAAKPTN